MSIFDDERQKTFEEEENLKIKVFAKYQLVSLKYSGEPRIPTPQVNQTEAITMHPREPECVLREEMSVNRLNCKLPHLCILTTAHHRMMPHAAGQPRHPT